MTEPVKVEFENQSLLIETKGKSGWREWLDVANILFAILMSIMIGFLTYTSVRLTYWYNQNAQAFDEVTLNLEMDRFVSEQFRIISEFSDGASCDDIEFRAVQISANIEEQYAAINSRARREFSFFDFGRVDLAADELEQSVEARSYVNSFEEYAASISSNRNCYHSAQVIGQYGGLIRLDTKQNIIDGGVVEFAKLDEVGFKHTISFNAAQIGSAVQAVNIRFAPEGLHLPKPATIQVPAALCEGSSAVSLLYFDVDSLGRDSLAKCTRLPGAKPGILLPHTLAKLSEIKFECSATPCDAAGGTPSSTDNREVRSAMVQQLTRQSEDYSDDLLRFEKQVAPASLSTPAKSLEGWVYLGLFKDKQWQAEPCRRNISIAVACNDAGYNPKFMPDYQWPSFADFESALVGQTFVVNADQSNTGQIYTLNIRDDRPSIFGRLGRIQHVIQQGDQGTIRSVYRSINGHLWAKIETV
ncbi:MAG: hypothetical protein AAF529_00300 [Pseudomonadota bacterium]